MAAVASRGGGFRITALDFVWHFPFWLRPCTIFFFVGTTKLFCLQVQKCFFWNYSWPSQFVSIVYPLLPFSWQQKKRAIIIDNGNLRATILWYYTFNFISLAIINLYLTLKNMPLWLVQYLVLKKTMVKTIIEKLTRTWTFDNIFPTCIAKLLAFLL